MEKGGLAREEVKILVCSDGASAGEVCVCGVGGVTKEREGT